MQFFISVGVGVDLLADRGSTCNADILAVAVARGESVPILVDRLAEITPGTSPPNAMADVSSNNTKRIILFFIISPSHLRRVYSPPSKYWMPSINQSSDNNCTSDPASTIPLSGVGNGTSSGVGETKCGFLVGIGSGVSVATSIVGTGVSVSVGGGGGTTSVLVGGNGVGGKGVFVLVGSGVFVLVGGRITLVFVGRGVLVLVGGKMMIVLVGGGVFVLLGRGVLVAVGTWSGRVVAVGDTNLGVEVGAAVGGTNGRVGDGKMAVDSGTVAVGKIGAVVGDGVDPGGEDGLLDVGCPETGMFRRLAGGIAVPVSVGSKVGVMVAEGVGVGGTSLQGGGPYNP